MTTHYYQKEIRQLFPRGSMRTPQQMLATLARSQSPSKQQRLREREEAAFQRQAAEATRVKKYKRRLSKQQK